MPEIKVFTIGFTKKPAERFFGLLRASGAKRIVDIRLNNSSQLAGFAKRDDLEFFARELCGLSYVHIPELAPNKEILDAYKKNGGDWQEFERRFLQLMRERQVEHAVSKELVDGGCLLCSEDKPDHCHRRLAAEYLQRQWGEDVIVEHLL